MTFLYLIFFSAFNFAQVGTTADSLGGAGVAHAHPTESALLNPAGLAFFSDAYFAGIYRYGKSTLGGTRQYNAVIADADEENLFVGSVAYRQVDYDDVPGGEIQEKEFVANAAYRLPSLAIGLRGYKKQTDVFGAKVDQYNSDLGIHWISTDHLAFGITQTGMFSTKNYQYPLGVLPATTLGGMFAISELFSIFADFSYAYNQNPNDRFVHAVGLSLQHLEFLRINVGGRFDDRSGETSYTAGLQFHGPRLKVGYAYQKEVRKELGEMHTFDISVNL